jgi:hypothetical protein
MYMTVEGNGGWNRIVNPTGGNHQAGYRRKNYPSVVALSHTRALPMLIEMQGGQTWTLPAC